MRPEDGLLFAACRQDFFQAHQTEVLSLCNKHPVNWDIIFSTAEQHSVAPLVYANLSSLQDLTLPPEVDAKFRASTRRTALRKDIHDKKLTEALEYFQERSIEVMLVKGIAFDFLVYKQPWYTTAKDIDLVLRLKREQVSEQEFRETQHFMHGRQIEYDYYTHHDITINGALPVDFDRIWQDAVRCSYKGRLVYLMSPEDMLLSACINSCRKRFFRLKSLCDISEILAFYRNLDWALTAEKTKLYDCSSIIYAALIVTRMAMGIDLPGDLKEMLGVNPVRAWVLTTASRILYNHTSLVAYPHTGFNLWSAPVHLSLLLPYTAYKGYQIKRKVVENYQRGKQSF
jgi:hypothetical protein